MGKTKSYNISKHIVMDAFKRVKANRGSAGVDEETIEEFERSLNGNLYKLWNRMSSGSYFPSPGASSRYRRKMEGKDLWEFRR